MSWSVNNPAQKQGCEGTVYFSQLSYFNGSKIRQLDDGQTDLSTNHSLVPVCQWFVSCIGWAAWENWHGETQCYAHVFGSAWILLVWSTEHGAKDLPGRHEWLWCPCSHHMINRIIYWQHGVFLWVFYKSGAEECDGQCDNEKTNSCW